MTESGKTGRGLVRALGILVLFIGGIGLLSRFGDIIAIGAAAGAIFYGLSLLRNKNPLELEA
ncbi:hypothetical protein [Paenibacillus sp. YN15]|uniref:hypothetical protein n=1 Tax=Paenibacillus sp. YN15 TaxID=1742774 RepID=UPI000DCE138F|nr:hypothetical protein [Paenibacillus sp. YN15]RAU94905.1 hypothetical protein DQG13_23090 [Paenibacillus sp. YN15]